MIVSQPQNTQQVLFAQSSAETQSGQTIKLINSNASNLNLQGSPTKITLAQAQQLGILSAGKVQQILPATQKSTVNTLFYFSLMRNKKNLHIIILSFRE